MLEQACHGCPSIRASPPTFVKRRWAGTFNAGSGTPIHLGQSSARRLAMGISENGGAAVLGDDLHRQQGVVHGVHRSLACPAEALG